MRDLQNAKWMYLKAGMFVGIGGVCSGLIILGVSRVQTTILLALTIWAFCRAYYFAFYVIERYIDPSFKFSGLASAILFLLTRLNARSPRLPTDESL